MKKTALCLALAAGALFAASANAQTTDPTGFFLEGRIGSASIDEDQFDDDTTAFQFNGGYRWGNFGLEAGYVNFDDFDDELEDIEVQAGIDGFTLGVNGRTNLGDRFPTASLHLAVEGVLGWPEAAPYDGILVSAGARHVPDELVDQLTPAGVMVIPVNSVMLKVTRTRGGRHVEKHGRYSFVPLVGG